MSENKKTPQELLTQAALLGGAGYAGSKIPRRVADYMHNYLEGYYGPGVNKWQKTQLMGREAAKATRRFAYNSLLDPVEVMAYDKTGVAPQVYRRWIDSEKQIKNIKNIFIRGGMSYDDAKFHIRNLEKQVHFKLTNDFSNAHMFEQKPQKALSDYASKYVQKSTAKSFENSAGNKKIANYVTSRWGLPNTKGVLFMKYNTPAWADVVRGAQFDNRFYKAMTTLKNHTGNIEMAVEKVNSLARRDYFSPNATKIDGKVVFQVSPRWKSNFDWGGYNAVGVWDPKKGDKIRIIATDKRDVIGGFKGGGRDTLNYVDSKEITIKEATRKIKEATNDPVLKPERKREYAPRKYNRANRIEKAKTLRVGGTRNVLKNELGIVMNKYGDDYLNITKSMKNPAARSSMQAVKRLAPYLLRRAGAVGMGAMTAFEIYNWIKGRNEGR